MSTPVMSSISRLPILQRSSIPIRPLAALHIKTHQISKNSTTTTITSRTFTSTPHPQQLPSDAFLARKHASIPEYPHPPRKWYKQSNFGLYGRATIQSGNTVSAKTETKTRRKWHPNVRSKRLYSESLGRWVRVRVVARVLRSIDKAGGLDAYLLGEKSARVKDLGLGGWALRWRVLRTEKGREAWRAQRAQLGLEGRPPWEVAEEELERLRMEKGEGRGIAEEAEAGAEADLETVLAARERAIDEALDRDEEAAARGEEAGTLLQDLESKPLGSMYDARGKKVLL